MVGDDTICAARLQGADDIPRAVHFDAAKNVLRRGDATKVWRVPLVAEVDEATAGRCKCAGLVNEVGVAMGAFGEDLVEDLDEAWIFREGRWSWWEVGRGAYGEAWCWRVGGQQREQPRRMGRVGDLESILCICLG